MRGPTTSCRGLSTADVKALLRERYKAPNFAILFEVPDGTGANQRGFADAIAMSLWPSHGLSLEGFEIKISRSDWLRERKSPEKAERFAARCDLWSLVTPADVKVVLDPEEIPAHWGWKRATRSGIETVRPPSALDPVPLDRQFLAGLLRAAGKLDAGLVEAAVQVRLQQLRSEDERNLQYRIDQARESDRSDARVLEMVRSLLGPDVDLGYLRDQTVAAAIVAVIRSGAVNTATSLARLSGELEKALAGVQGALSSLQLPAPDPNSFGFSFVGEKTARKGKAA